MIDFAAVKKRRELRGVTVVAFVCNGCMGHDHQFNWMGRVERFEEKWGREHAVARVLKRGNQDVRDTDLGVVHIPLHDSQLQQIHGSIYAYYQ